HFAVRDQPGLTRADPVGYLLHHAAQPTGLSVDDVQQLDAAILVQVIALEQVGRGLQRRQWAAEIVGEPTEELRRRVWGFLHDGLRMRFALIHRPAPCASCRAPVACTTAGWHRAMVA